MQYRIQDFPGAGGRGTNSQSGSSNQIFLAENYMKMKELGPPGVCVTGAPLDPPML